MSDKFKALFEEARQSGLPDEWVDRFEESFEASGLRKDLKATQDQARQLMEQNKAMRTGLLGDRFAKLGITISPKVLNIPDDLDPTDEEKVTTWAQEMGLVEKKETTPPAERAVHDRIAAASNEGGNTATPTLQDFDPTKLSEAEFWEKAQAYEAAQKRI